MTVGLMMVVRNEAHRIADCLAYHLPYFDQAVICDQQSDDGTWPLLHKCVQGVENVTLWQDIQHGHCAPSRQATLDMLTTEWVCMVDADEMFNVDFLKDMHNIAQKADHHKVDCYTLLRRNSFDVQVYDDTVAAEPKWLNVVHPVIERQFRFFNKKDAIFDNQLHGRVHFTHQENIGHLPHIIEHRKTLTEMHQDLARFRVVNGK